MAGNDRRLLKTSKKLVHALLLVDIRHDPTEGDKMMAGWFRYYEIPFTIVAAKCDKIAKSKRKIRGEDIRKKLELLPGASLLYYSTPEKLGREELWDLLDGITAG